MRTLLAATLLLGALLSLTNVSAFQAAAVTHGMEVTVTTTNSAGLSLIAGSGNGNSTGMAYYTADNTALLLDFRKGYGGGTYAFGGPNGGLAGDQYIIYGVFSVQNNAAASRCVKVYVNVGGVTGLNAIYLGGVQVAGAGGSTTGGCATLSAGTTAAVDFSWVINSTLPAGDFDVWVDV